MKRQITAAEAAKLFLSMEEPGRIMAAVPTGDGSFQYTKIDGFTLERMHRDRTVEFYVDEPTAEDTWQRLREEVRKMESQRRGGQDYLVLKNGEPFAAFTWKTDAIAYVNGAREQDTSSEWELDSPEDEEDFGE